MKNFLTQPPAVHMFMAILLTLAGISAFSQLPATDGYLPQIRLTATNGFGPYVAGTQQSNTILAYDLPAGTSAVTFRFIDSDSVQIGAAHTVNGTGIDSVAWKIGLDTLHLPLSPMFHLKLTYDADSTADYYIPYTVYPDSVSFSATQGWGPFVTNQYSLSDTSWHPVPQLSNNFTVSNLPPRTDTVIFQVTVSDTIVLLSHTVTASPGGYLTSATYPGVRMDNLPLNTTSLKALVKAGGFPTSGLAFHKDLLVTMQKPRLYSNVGGIHLTNAIPQVTENPIGGQALLVDSTKYAVITNGPGVQMTTAPYNYQGPYSVDIIEGQYTIEGWIRVNPDPINNSTDKNMTFIRVDSLFEISLSTPFGDPIFQVNSLLGGELLQICYIFFDPSTWGHQPVWHHFAFVSGDPSQQDLFYLDGELLGAYFNESNVNYIRNTYYFNNGFKNYMKTKPLILGGCNAQHPITTGDLSFITALDEVRFWNRALTGTEIVQNMNTKILQNNHLTGYWNFDDQRNRLHFISDLSYSNNSGQLFDGSAFIPENPELYSVDDTLLVKTSNAATDSILFSFVDRDNTVTDSLRTKVQNHEAQLFLDLSDLSYTVNQLRVTEIVPGESTTSAVTMYPLHIIPAAPVATPQSNWGNYYYSANGFGSLTNPILITGLPDGTSGVVMGLEKNDTLFDVDSLTQNSVPYRYSLHLNGTDNYIETSQNLVSPSSYTISLWFKTTTKLGGKLIGFCETQNGITTGSESHDRELLMETDGSLRFVFNDNVSTQTLYGSNKYNDGAWHCVTINVEVNDVAEMYIDNSIVDYLGGIETFLYNGYWVIGHNGPTDALASNAIASYFQGDLAYISISTSKDKATSQPDPALLNGAPRGNMLYQLNEGSGTVIHDSQGGNTGTLKGSGPTWYSTNKVSTLRWQANMLANPPGTYTFFTKVYYPGSGDKGVTYPLGTFTILEPMPGNYFNYNLQYGNGYFNEGSALPNIFFFETDYSGQGQPGWSNNFLRYFVISPDHQIIDQNIFTWTVSGTQGQISIDMGDIVPGSYLSIEIGYQSAGPAYHTAGNMTIPILVRPMLAPTVSGDFGPFEQAIAPGTMSQPNTFTLSEPNLTDLTKVIATFYDLDGNLIATANGVKVSDTAWQITQDMAPLSPPETDMKIAYYLGSNEFLALVAGPYKITIHKTRPDWFDIIPDTCFHNIQQRGDSVMFLVDTPFDNSYVINNAAAMNVPSWIPLLGGSDCSMSTPTGQASLKYKIVESKLSLNSPPQFFQKLFQLGEGDPHVFAFGFDYSQNNTYTLTATNDLLAEQNFSMGGNITSRFEQELTIVQRIKKLMQLAGAVDPQSVIVSPDLELQASGSFKYSSRLNLRIDTLTGNWGSYGNLDIDANPAHGSAYTNSASYHFYGGSMGIELALGAKILEGLLSGYFGLQGIFDLGFGHSYVSIPSPQRKPLKSLAFQTYGRFYIDILWDWYERNIWGPKLFYSTTIWGDDMTDAFPPDNGISSPGSLKVESSPEGIATGIRPVSSFSQIPLPSPQASVESSDDCLLISWLEPGSTSGERKLRCQYLNFSGHDFSDRKTLDSNHMAMNSPMTDLSGDSMAFITWAQSRYDSKGFATSGSTDPLTDFIRSQDIWYGVFNLRQDTLVKTGQLADNTLTALSGRAEANPMIIRLSPTRAMITWQVIQDDLKAANIWYAILERGPEGWNQATQPAPVTSGTDIKTQLQVAGAPGGEAVLAWMNTSKEGDQNSTVRASRFDGVNWSAPETISAPGAIRCNYLDMKIKGENGGLVYTHFVEDTVHGHHEKLVLVPWISGQWNPGEAIGLLVDSACHLQLPNLALHGTRTAAVAVKREVLNLKTSAIRISQTDLFKGELNAPAGSWKHAVANPYFCDTTRQLRALQLGFINHDTLMLLSQENEPFAANAASVPLNGRVFGDPYMDQVLRLFTFLDDGTVNDVDENHYFTGIDAPKPSAESASTLRCFPNPCTDHTTVAFYVGKTSQVSLEIFNMAGVLVANVFHRKLPAGYFEMGINTTLLQAGTYLCRLSGDATHTFKLVVTH